MDGNTFKSHQEVMMSRLKNTAFSVGLTSTSGIILGSFLAACKNRNKYSFAFQMGANWFLCSLPFFIVRDVMIHSSQDRSIPTTFRERSKTDLFASILSGTILGGGIGFIWRGPFAIVPVGIVHGFGAGIGQSIYTLFDNWRIKKAIARLENTNDHESSSISSSISISTTSPRNYLWDLNIDSSIPLSPSTLEYPYQQKDWKDKLFALSASEKDAFFLDPVKSIYDGIASLLETFRSTDHAGQTLDEWEWLRNATNIEYRKKLSFKVILLKEQIIELRKELDRRGIDRQSHPVSSPSSNQTTVEEK